MLNRRNRRAGLVVSDRFAIEQEKPVSGLAGIRQETREHLPLGKRLAWLEELTGGLAGGGAYLVAGAPGGGKSRLATQIALELGAAGSARWWC